MQRGDAGGCAPSQPWRSTYAGGGMNTHEITGAQISMESFLRGASSSVPLFVTAANRRGKASVSIRVCRRASISFFPHIHVPQSRALAVAVGKVLLKDSPWEAGRACDQCLSSPPPAALQRAGLFTEPALTNTAASTTSTHTRIMFGQQTSSHKPSSHLQYSRNSLSLKLYPRETAGRERELLTDTQHAHRTPRGGGGGLSTAKNAGSCNNAHRLV